MACTIAAPLLLLVLLVLRHVAASRSSQPGVGSTARVAATPGDSATLLQLNVGTKTEADVSWSWLPIASALQNARWPVPVFQNARRHRHNFYDFPLRIPRKGSGDQEDVYHFVGSASLTLDVSALHIHCYDVAMYLNIKNEEWETVRHRHAATLKALLGQVQFVLVMQSAYITNKVMADVTSKLLQHAKSLNASDPSKDIANYGAMWLRAPPVKPGAEVVLFPSADGISARINRMEMGLVKSTFLGPATLESYLGEQSSLPEFRDRIFSNLGRGMTEEIEEPAQVATTVHAPWWFTMIKVVAVVAVVLCLCGTGCCCFRHCRSWKET